MTAREKLNQQMRRSGTAMYAGAGLFFVCVLLSIFFEDERPVILVLSLPGFGLAAIGMLVQFAMRCPHCGGNIGRMLMQGGSLYVDAQLRYCPLCGHGLDEELPAEEDAATHC